MRVVYVNLTNGIEAIPQIQEPYRFIRIQSTICEQKNWDRLIQELDYDFLMNIAVGNEVVVYDYGARKPIPRAIYQGMEFIRYVLNRRWYGRVYRTDISRTNQVHIRKGCDAYFEQCYLGLEDRTKKKLDYFKPFLLIDEVRISTVSFPTVHDGDKRYYREVLSMMNQEARYDRHGRKLYAVR